MNEKEPLIKRPQHLDVPTEPQVFSAREAEDVIALEWLMKTELKTKIFDKHDEAVRFGAWCLGMIPLKLGVVMPQNIPSDLVPPFLKSFGVVIKKKMYPEEDRTWRNGFYIYKDNDIKYFVSFPPLMRAKDHRFEIKTNLKE